MKTWDINTAWFPVNVTSSAFASSLTSDCNLSCLHVPTFQRRTDGDADALEKPAAVFVIYLLFPFVSSYPVFCNSPASTRQEKKKFDSSLLPLRATRCWPDGACFHRKLIWSYGKCESHKQKLHKPQRGTAEFKLSSAFDVWGGGPLQGSERWCFHNRAVKCIFETNCLCFHRRWICIFKSRSLNYLLFTHSPDKQKILGFDP